jgi:phosphate-selective porin OprO/OprP
MNRRALAFLLAAGIAVVFGGSVRAQDPSTTQDMKTRIERLEKQNQELLTTLQRMQVTPTSPTPGSAASGASAPVTLTPADVKSIAAEVQKEQEAAKKSTDDAAKAKTEDEGYKIGSDLKMSATWKNGVWLETPNKDFTMHIGGWIQYDNVFFDQSPGLLAPQGGFSGTKQGVASGAKQGGTGDFQDGTYFRRIRLMTDGNFWEQYEYTLILALENNQFTTIGLDEFWVGAKDIPGIGTARIGHVKNAIGFEADMTASSRTMTFMERSAYSESIELNQNFVTGLWLGDAWFDQRATYTFVVFRPDQASSTGVFFGDGQWGMQGRLTALPIWEDDGRCWTHVGVSGGWRNGTNNIANTPFRTFELRARPELRDDDPAGNPGGAQPVPNANDARLIDTGVAVCNNEWLLGLEYCTVWGPFSVQAEYGFNWLEDVQGFNPKNGAAVPGNLVPALKTPLNYFFSGGYVQLAYTLTGENRAYDKRLGRLNTYYFNRQGPFNNAWFVRDDEGHYCFNWGAWEIAGRYTYVNLNDGEGINRVQGGVFDGFTVGLNWYLNDNLKFQFDYVYNQRSDLPPGVVEGSVRGLGMRMQFMY